MALDFQQAFLTLDNMGVTEILLPFLLVFTLVFAIFQKMKILGADAKKFNVIIALAVAFAVVMPHLTGRGPDVIPIINNSLPSVGAVAVAIIMALFLMGMFGLDFAKGGFTGVLGTLAILTVAYIFAVSAGWFEQSSMLSFLFDSDTQALIVIILVFAIIIGVVTSDAKKPGEKSLLDRLNDTFNKQS